jgi:hypothetical protein
MSFNSFATPKTLQEGYSLHASENDAGAASAVVVVVMANPRAPRMMGFEKCVFMVMFLSNFC